MSESEPNNEKRRHMDNTKVGDVIVLWNMPYPEGTFFIRLATGVNCDHCPR